MSKIKTKSCALVLLISSVALAQGGPPLVTDDPGTPGDKHWEINSAVQWAVSEDSGNLQVPLLDVNYGYGDHVQLNLNSSWITVTQYGQGTVSGVSVASAAVKWRFVDEELRGVAVSIYPRVDFHHSLSSDDPQVNPPGRRYFLPLEVSKGFGRFGVNPEIGYAYSSDFSPEWVYGVAISYALVKETEVLFEVHGRSRVDSGEREFLYNVGTRYAMKDNLSFIGSFGKTVATYADEPASWNLYVGFQFRL